MDNEPNLDSLFEDAVKIDAPAEEPQAEEKPEEPAKEPEKAEQDQAERARQAMARRLREAEERGARAERARMDEIIQALDLSDPDTNEAVDTADKLEAYRNKKSKERLANGKPTEADIRRIVAEEREKAQPPKPQENPLEDPRIKAELAQIKAMDPAMVDINAIMNSDAGPKFREYVNKGLNFVDAYTLAAKDRLASINANREGARSAGKDHLNPTKQRGSGALDVPADEMALFRELNPGASAEDIQKYYNADRRKYGPK